MEYIPLLPPEKDSDDSEFWFKWLLNNISFIGGYINSHAPDVLTLTKSEKQEYFRKLIDLKNTINGTLSLLKSVLDRCDQNDNNENMEKENQNEL